MSVITGVALAASAAATGYGMANQPDYAGLSAQQEAQRQQAIKSGQASIDNAYSGFTPDFYTKRAQAYTDYALPQLAQQYTGARNQIGFNLANRGLFGGSAANKSWTDLANTMSTAKQGIIDTGTSQAQQLQNQVEQSKQGEINQLYQSADPAAAAAGATATASGFASPASFQPLANQFNGLLQNYYAGQLINAYRPLAAPAASFGSDQTQLNTIPSQISGH